MDVSASDTTTRLALLYRLSREISGRLEPGELLPRLLKETVDSIQASAGSIIIFDEAGGVWHSAVMTAGRFQPDTDRSLAETVRHGLAGWVVENRQPALVRNTAQDPRWMQRPDDHLLGPKSAISVPLLGREGVVGVMTVVKVPALSLMDADLDLLTVIAEQAGIAVENVRLFAASQQRLQAVQALAEASRAINATLELDEVLRLIVQHAYQLFQVEAASVALIEGESLVYREAVGAAADKMRGRALRLGQGIAGWVALTNQPALVPDVDRDPRFFRGVDSQTGFITRAAACAPVQLQGSVIGIIQVINPLSGAFDRETLNLLGSLGSLAATAIVHARRMEELQAAENRFAGLFEDNIDPILITDLDGIITEANRRAMEFFGYLAEELAGLRITTVHHTGTGWLGSDRFKLVREGQKIDYQTRITTKNGTEVPVEVHAKLIKRGGQEFIQWIQHDLSERLALEEMRSDMISMIVHDLRSPLGNIVSSLEVVQTSLAPEQEAEQHLLAIANRSALRLSRLMDSLLDLRRLETGQMVLDRRQTNVNTLVAEAVEQVHVHAEGKEVQIKFDIPPRLPFVDMDGDMIRRVLINLLENAIKYMGGPGTVTVMARANPSDVTLSVRDTGPGIPRSEHTRIFNRFARLRSENGPRGAGLGLAFCKLAVEAHGGRIWVESQMGRGATFSFTIPFPPA